MKDWKKVKEAVDRIFTSTQSDRKKMTKYLKHFKGEIWDVDELKTKFSSDYDSEAFINMLFASVEAQAPLITDSKPITKIIPEQPFMRSAANMYNYGLRYYWEKEEIQDKVYKMVLDATIMGKGIMKVYRDPDKRMGGLCCEVVDPRNFFIAPGHDDEWEAPFVGERGSEPMSWVRANFPDKMKDIKPTAEVCGSEEYRDQYKYGENPSAQDDTYFVRVYKVWMQDDGAMEGFTEEEDGEKVKKERPKNPNGKFVFFTDSVFLGEEPSEFDHGLPPYIGMDNYTNPHNFLSISDSDQIDDLNTELNIQFQAIAKYSKKHHDPNYWADSNAIDDVEKIQKEKNKGGNVWPVDMTLVKGQPIQPINEGDFRPEVMRFFQMLKEAIEHILGVTDVTKGVASSKEQSASEVAILAESSHTRIRQKVRNLEKSLKRVAYILVRMMMQYMDKPEMINYLEEDSDERMYAPVGNDKATLGETIAPQGLRQAAQNPEFKATEAQEQALNDYKAFQEYYEELGDLDPVYFPFDIEIETNSSLPLDKQSRATMAMKLFERKAIDEQALLEAIQWPNYEEVMKRIKQREAQNAARKRPPRQR